jgi:hypothetical protein
MAKKAKGNPFGKNPMDNPFLKGKKKGGKGNLAPPFGKKKK